MEHLLLPADPAYPPQGPPRVPLVCGDTKGQYVYGDGPFSTYPERVGWPQVLASASQPSFAWLELKQPSDEKQLECFLQEWIFFGLLHEMLSPYDLYDSNDFIREDELGKVVHTLALADKAQAWLEAIQMLPTNAARELADHLAACLSLAGRTLRCLWPFGSEQRFIHPGFDRGIRLSLAAIVESLSHLFERHFDKHFPDIEWSKPDPVAALHDDEREHLRRIDWCPNFIAKAEGDFSSVSGLWYVRYLKMPGLHGSHSECSEWDCKSMQIDPATYQLRHTEATCSCALLSPDPEDVADCLLQRESYPVIQLMGDEDEPMGMNAIPYVSDEKTPYVALSHVWADGLGNQQAIALPACQIHRLQRLVRGINGRTFVRGPEGDEQVLREDRKLFLWCDSLLCPVIERLSPTLEQESKERQEDLHQRHERSVALKTAALARMADVYKNSAYTLVLDAEVMGISVAQVGLVEATFRVLASGWALRLWTYQESILPSKLLIQFADGPLDFRILWQHVRDLYRSTPLQRGLYRDIATLCGSLHFHASRTDQNVKLTLIQANVGRRGCSVAADEPLCTATLLNLDTAAVAQVRDGAERMAMLWRLVDQTEYGIPDGIVFNNFVRLELPGFRWAPASFRHMSDPAKHMSFFSTPQEDSNHRGELTPDGLAIQRSLWRIHPAAAPITFAPKNLLDKSLENMIHVHAQDGHYFTMLRSDSNIASAKVSEAHPAHIEGTLWSILVEQKHAEWAALLDAEIPANFQKPQRAILGRLDDCTASGVPVFRSECLVEINRQGAIYSKIMNSATDHAQRLLGHEIFTLYRCSYLLSHAVRRFPVAEHHLPRSMLETVVGPAITRMRGVVFQHLVREVRTWAAETFASDEVASYLRAVNPTATADGLMAHYLICFTRRMVMISAEHSSESSWCVD